MSKAEMFGKALISTNYNNSERDEMIKNFEYDIWEIGEFEVLRFRDDSFLVIEDTSIEVLNTEDEFELYCHFSKLGRLIRAYRL